MKTLNSDNYIKKQNMVLMISLLVHLAFFVLNLFVGGYNCDEAMTILNARSLADCGRDILGEKLPVYFDTWLYTGQSPMSTYAVALSVKLLGANYFAYRIPMFILGMIGLFAFKTFLNEVFINNNTAVQAKHYKYVFAILILAAFSPWHIFSSTYMLDCNFFPHFMVIGMMFLAKAVNSQGNKLYYALSMVFFGLCFYCYVASVLILPVFLAIFFLVLMIKKKIPLSCVVTSVLTIFIVALPFILFGLVSVKAIEPFSLFGFSFSEMPYYTRGDSITLNSQLGLLGTLKNMMLNFIGAARILVIPDICILNPDGMFCYTNFIGGFIMLFGMVMLAVKLFRKHPFVTFQAKLFGVCSVVSVLFFCFVSDSGYLATAYRFGVFFYLLILIEGVGFIEISEKIKKINLKKFACIFMAASFVLFTAEFVFVYMKNINVKNSFTYGDSFYDCVSFIQDDCEQDNFTVCVLSKKEYPYRNEHQAVFLKNYCYDKMNLNNFEDVLKSTGVIAYQNDWSEPIPQITADNSIKYQDICKIPKLTDDYNILYNYAFGYVDYDSNEYSVKTFGLWSVLYRAG